jgi:hypothetical protein
MTSNYQLCFCKRFGIKDLMKYFRQLMKSSNKAKLSNWLSSIFMMLALAWLTVCLPVVYGAQQDKDNYAAAENLPTEEAPEDDSTNNPFANTTEEKTPNSVNIPSEEYLHDSHAADNYIAVPSTEYKLEHVPIYLAFHGELISPPPDVAHACI